MLPPSTTLGAKLGRDELGQHTKRHSKRIGREPVVLWLDRNIVDHFRHDGPGWQTRINDALAELVKRNTR